MLGVGLANPIVPLFAESFRVSYTLVGFAVGAYGLARLVFEIPAGSWADRFGRRPLLNIGLLMFTISGIIAYFAGDIGTLSVARFVQGVGAGLYITPALAVLGDIAPRDQIGRYTSLYFASDFLGFAIGPAIGGYVGELAGFRSAFFLLAVLSGIAFLLSYLLISESGIHVSSEDSFEIKQLPRAMLDPKILLLGCTAVSSFFIASGIRNTAVPLIGQSQGLPTSQIGLVLTVGAFVNACVLISGRRIIDALGRVQVLFIAFLSTGLVLLFFPLAVGFLALTAMTGIISLTTSLIPPTQSAIVIDIANPERRALSFGLFRTFGDAGILVGPVVVGYLSDQYGFAAPFYVAFVLCAATLLVVLELRKFEINDNKQLSHAKTLST